MPKTSPRAAKPKPNFLAQVPSLQEQYADRKTLCDGSETGFQCVHYFAQVSPTMTQVHEPKSIVPSSYERTNHYKRDRYCLKGSSTKHMLDLGFGGKDMLVHCTEYVPADGKAHKPAVRPYDPFFETAENDTRLVKETGWQVPPPKTADALMAQVMAGEAAALATGRPMMAEGGGEPKETRFQGPPVDTVLHVGDKTFIGQAWQHDSRGWLVLVVPLGICGTGPDRAAAEADAVQRVLALNPPQLSAPSPASDASAS